MTEANSINSQATGIVGNTGTAFVSTAVTNHGIVLGGSSSSTLGNVGPSATAGQVLQSAGSSADPSFSTATYPSTAGTSGNVLTSNGTNFVSSALPAAVYDPPIGSMQYFANSAGDAYLGANWLKCNGASVSQATYATLYTRLGLISDVQKATLTSVSNLPATTNSIVLGNSLFVAVGASGAISTSTDLITWTTRTSGTASNLNSITYGNGLYLAAGVTSALINSTDGITWSALTYGVTTTIVALGFGNGKYLASSTSGAMRTSTDTITWGAVTANAGGVAMTSINYGNSTYVWTTASSTTAVGYSTDAVTWTALTMSVPGPGISNATFFNSLFIGYCSKSNNDPTVILYSTDGIKWLSSAFQYAYAPTTDNKGIFNTGTKIYALLHFQTPTPRPVFIGISTDGLNFNVYNVISTTVTANIVAATANNVMTAGAGTQYYAALYTYNTATNFILPTEVNIGGLGNQPTAYNLYIKAL
jgi:hypothetical protein